MDQAVDRRVVEVMEAQLLPLDRFVRGLVRDADESADVCQETCVRLLVAARAHGLPDAPGAWMKRVAYNIVISSARRRRTADRFAHLFAERDAVPSLDETVLEREQTQEVAAVLAATRTSDRDAIVMAANGYRVREIAAHLGRTENATRTLLSRARGRMRDRRVLADFG